MRITDLLDKRSIAFDKNPANKQETLDMAVDLMCASGKINDTEAYRKQVYLREEESTTGIGEGIAIPHGKGDCVSKPGLAAMVIKNGVDFDSLDGDPVTLLFLIAAPNTEDNVHLEVLSKLSMMLMDEQFTEALRNATSAEEFLSIIDKADDERADIDEQLADTGNAESDFELELTFVKDHPQNYDLGECEFHLAFRTADFEAAHKLHEEMGCICFENPEMGIYFITDPDGYWLEIVPER